MVIAGLAGSIISLCVFPKLNAQPIPHRLLPAEREKTRGIEDRTGISAAWQVLISSELPFTIAIYR
jgi:hypothetical protein